MIRVIRTMYKPLSWMELRREKEHSTCHRSCAKGKKGRKTANMSSKVQASTFFASDTLTTV